jgi:hypothetical protein
MAANSALVAILRDAILRIAPQDEGWVLLRGFLKIRAGDANPVDKQG